MILFDSTEDSDCSQPTLYKTGAMDGCKEIVGAIPAPERKGKKIRFVYAHTYKEAPFIHRINANVKKSTIGPI